MVSIRGRKMKRTAALAGAVHFVSFRGQADEKEVEIYERKEDGLE